MNDEYRIDDFPDGGCQLLQWDAALGAHYLVRCFATHHEAEIAKSILEVKRGVELWAPNKERWPT